MSDTTLLSKISIREKFASLDDRWSPKIVATVDDFAIELVKIGITMKYRIDGVEREVAFGPGEIDNERTAAPASN